MGTEKLLAVLDGLDQGIAEAAPEEIALILGRLELARHDALDRVRPKGQVLSTEQDDDILLMPEVARLLRRNVETVREWGRKGVLPTVALGKRGVGVLRGALRAFKVKLEKRVVRFPETEVGRAADAVHKKVLRR